jgi:hypothetical protein
MSEEQTQGLVSGTPQADAPVTAPPEPEAPIAGTPFQSKEPAPVEVKAEPASYSVEGVDSTDPVAQQYLAQVKQLGLSKEQAQSLFNWAKGLSPTQDKPTEQKQSPPDYDKLNQVGLTELKKTWGETTEQKLRAAQNVYRRLPKDIGDYIDSTGLGSDPHIIRMFYELSQNMEDRSLHRDEIMNAESAQSARQKVAEILNDTKHPYHNRKASGHSDAVEYMQSLYKIIYGG